MRKYKIYTALSKQMMILMIMVCGNTLLSACKKDEVLQKPVLINKIVYVAPNGNDGNDGTLELPFKTINYALGVAAVGDTIKLRGGTYNEKVKFPKSGVLNKYITLTAFEGEHPVISGEGLGVFGNEGLITASSVSWIIIEGLEITGLKTTRGASMPDGILIDGASSNIIVRNNKIHHIEHNGDAANGRQAHAISVLGNSSSPIMKITIEKNEVHDNNTGTSENVTVNGYVIDFTIRNNKIYNGTNIAICVAGGYAGNANAAFNYARNGLVADNEIWNIDGTTGRPTPIFAFSKYHGAIGIYIDGARNITVERNKVYDSDRGIGLVSENNNFPTQNCIVRNNLVYNCWLVGIYLGGYDNFTGGGTNNCYVLNNTLYKNSRVLGPGDVMEGEIRLTKDCKDNVIKNNIIYAGSPGGLFINKKNPGNNILGYNLYYTDGPATNWTWDNVPYTSFEAWKNASGDSNSIFGSDPKFINQATYDLHLQPISVAKNAGQLQPEDKHGQTDIDGQQRVVNGKISLGADEIH